MASDLISTYIKVVRALDLEHSELCVCTKRWKSVLYELP